MKTLYLDCQAGISGDMTVAALLDLGVPLGHIETELARLGLPPDAYSLSAAPTSRHGFAAHTFDVALRDCHTHRHCADILEMIAGSALSERARELASRTFRRLAEAEGKVHGVPQEQVHFHEVGAIDSIVDIVATAICIDFLGVERIISSPLPLCSGFVESGHGLLPLPAPATAELLKGLTVSGPPRQGERVTPTGAAIVAALAENCTVFPAMIVDRIGYGAGSRDFPDLPNILRAFFGTTASGADSAAMVVIEANIDDAAPEVLGYALERLIAAGANDAWFTPVQMKKNRPAVMLSTICPPEAVEKFADIIFRETPAIGLRTHPVSRMTLERRIEERETEFGKVRFKVTESGEKPEYADCRQIALDTGLPLRDILARLQRGVADR